MQQLRWQRRTARWLLLLAVAVATTSTAEAQVPTFSDVVGHEFGERITEHHQMVRYLERLAETSPRVTLVDQGRSWEGKSLPLAIVTSPENHARLAEIQHTSQRLGDPRVTSPAEAAALIQHQPAVIWYGGSIHGFELSGTEGVLKLLEHLTTRDDPETLYALRNTVVLIDPILNPDGRDAFAQHNHQNLGRRVNPHPHDWANDFTSWQGLKFRTGHYYFDINRDWFAHTQRETQARVPTIRDWRPQVGIDAHEMGSEVEFYFDPPTDPRNPFFPDYASRWFDVFADNYVAAFDSAGFEYMTGERYNYFYPAYTTSFLSYQGAVGKLYEQGSTRGLALHRPDGTVRTLADALEQQYLASWTALRTTAQNRGRLLQEYYDAHRQAIGDGQRGVRRYVITPEGDPGLVAELANLLVRNGIEVHRLTEPTPLGGVRDREGRSIGRHTFPAGSFVVEAAQPRNRLIRALLEPEAPVPAEFLELARTRVERDENPRFYDITAWSLPLLFNVGGFSSTDARRLPVERVAGDASTPRLPTHEARYAYLIDGRQAASLAALYHLRDQGHRGAVLLEPSRIGGTDFASGTVIVRVGQNEPGVHQAVRALAERFRLDVDAVDTGRGDPGFPALGTGDAIHVQKPEIAILAEDPVQAYSFGWAWYTLDQQYEIPTTVLRAGSLANIPLDRYNVLVLPELSGPALARMLGDAGIERLQRWVRDGGTLVTIGGATDFARNELGLIALRSWYDTEAGREAQRITVPGAMFRTALDPRSWLAAGYDREVPVLVNSNRLYLPPDGPPAAARRVVARYGENSPRIAGHAWRESLERVPGAVFAYDERVGRGRVVSFAEDVNFRGYWRGSDRLFLNAVILGPSAP